MEKQQRTGPARMSVLENLWGRNISPINRVAFYEQGLRMNVILHKIFSELEVVKPDSAPAKACFGRVTEGASQDPLCKLYVHA